jgi:cell volume regulation protein A
LPAIEYILLVVAVLFLLSVLASKASARFGVPSLLLFAFIGMLAGSDGPGGIYFDHPWAAQSVGVVALGLILFAAGFDTQVEDIKPVFRQGLSLSTIGVICSALATGLFSARLLGMTLPEGLLLGAIISSTDAAAVFNVLRSKRVNLKGHLRELMEFESGSNDPMAVLLTLLFIRLIQDPNTTIASAAWFFFLQLGLGGAVGYLLGMAMIRTINAIKLEWDGLYPVLSLTMVLLTYSVTSALGGNGFLAVYVAGIVVGSANIIHRTTLHVFHDGVAWLMQIAMFLVLGLQVFPSRLPAIASSGMIIALFLTFVARPVSVFIALALSRLNLREKLLVSWAGIRGSAPIMLAPFALLAGIKQSGTIFDIVFFVALLSLLLQGTTIPLVSRWLRLDRPFRDTPAFPVVFNPTAPTEGQLVEYRVEKRSAADGVRLMDLKLPTGVLAVLVNRENQFVVPQGSTVLRENDRVLILTSSNSQPILAELFRESLPS